MRLMKQGKLFTDSGWQHWSLFECKVTGDVVIKFGNSFTLRGSPGELAPFFSQVGDIIERSESSIEVSER